MLSFFFLQSWLYAQALVQYERRRRRGTSHRRRCIGKRMPKPLAKLQGFRIELPTGETFIIHVRTGTTISEMKSMICKKGSSDYFKPKPTPNKTNKQPSVAN